MTEKTDFHIKTETFTLHQNLFVESRYCIAPLILCLPQVHEQLLC